MAFWEEYDGQPRVRNWVPIDRWLEEQERRRPWQSRPQIDDYIPAWRRTKDDADWPPGGVIE